MLLYKLYQDNRKESVNKGKWYGRAINISTIDTDGLISEIEKICTVSDADVVAVLRALIFVMNQKLNESHAVKLNGLGTFKIGIKTIPADEAKEFSAQKNIVGARVNFLPEGRKNAATNKQERTFLKNLKFKCITPTEEEEEEEP